MQTPQLWGDMRSRMSREAHVWICEGLGVKFPPGYSTGEEEKDPRLPDWANSARKREKAYLPE